MSQLLDFFGIILCGPSLINLILLTLSSLCCLNDWLYRRSQILRVRLKAFIKLAFGLLLVVDVHDFCIFNGNLCLSRKAPL